MGWFKKKKSGIDRFYYPMARIVPTTVNTLIVATYEDYKLARVIRNSYSHYTDYY